MASFVSVHWAFYEARFHRSTGEAEWIWTWNWISRQKPAAFFATRDFHLRETAPHVQIKIACDPMYTLYFNEVEVGGERWSRTRSIDVYDVTDLAHEGINRIVVAVRAPDGVGGLLVAVDAGPIRRNVVVTDERWRITEGWSASLLTRDGEGTVMPRLLGKPPWGKWNFPPIELHERYAAGAYVLHPIGRRSQPAALKKIEVVGGVVIAGREEVEATVYDFGPVSGRPRIVIEPGDLREVRFLTLDRLDGLQDGVQPDALVFAPGESVVTDPSSRAFRYFVAFDPIESVEVVSESP